MCMHTHIQMKHEMKTPTEGRIRNNTNMLQRPKELLTSYHHPAQDRDCTQPVAF